MKLIIILTFFCTVVYAQTEFPRICLQDIHECSINSEETYDGNSLWGYVNGGADVYLEYGFSKLLVQHVQVKKSKITVNIYQMSSPEAAFGIFSINKFKCLNEDSSFAFSCITKYQFQFAASEFYISIINENGTEEAQKSISDIAHILTNKIIRILPEFPAPFYSTDLLKYQKELKYFNGILGIQNGYPDWINLLEAFSDFSMYILSIEDNSMSENIAHIRFKSADDLSSFIEGLKLTEIDTVIISGEKYHIRKEDERTVLLSIKPVI